ncbi:TPA: hypothetical protein OCC30_004428 [Escherichia coli]|nr:hypothetical protein [Escherichia coli]
MQSRYLLSTLLLVCSAATSADNAGWQNARTPQTTNSASDHVQNASQNTGGVPATLVKGELPAPGQASPLVQDAARLDSELSADEIRSLRSLMADNERAINAPITSVVPRTRFMINPETRVIAVDLNNVAGDKTPAGRLKTGIMYLLAGQIAGGDFTLPQYRDEVLKQLPREYHEIALKRINQLDQEVKTKVYDELHNARGIDFIWENLDTQEREQRKFAIRTVLSTQYLRDYPESVLKSANTLWLLRYKPEDIPVLRDNFNVPEFMLKRFLKMPEGPAPDGSGVPVLGVFRVKSGTLARILKFTVGPLELWALNSSPKDSALRKTLTNKLGSVRARKILAENFPRGSATSLIEHRAGQHNSDNVIEELASELIRKQGYNL